MDGFPEIELVAGKSHFKAGIRVGLLFMLLASGLTLPGKIHAQQTLTLHVTNMSRVEDRDYDNLREMLKELKAAGVNS
jgi:hypothetical protein